MSPQPATAPAATAAESTLTDVLLDRIEDINPDDRTMGENQFLRAVDLENQRSEIQKQINSNREFLRLMAKNDALGDPQIAAWLKDFYPLKEKGSTRDRDEVERTRKAKAAARDK